MFFNNQLKLKTLEIIAFIDQKVLFVLYLNKIKFTNVYSLSTKIQVFGFISKTEKSNFGSI